MESPRFFKRLFLSDRQLITVEIPYYDFIRGKVFIDDLRDNFTEDVPFQFGISELLYMLYDDFLNQVKRGAKNDQIAGYLKSGIQRHFTSKKREKRILKPLTNHVFEFETIEEDDSPSQKVKTAYLDIRMKESEVLRAEVLLFDLEPFLGDTELSIEQMIAIVYLDFIDNVKAEGNSLKVQKSILAHLKKL